MTRRPLCALPIVAALAAFALAPGRAHAEDAPGGAPQHKALAKISNAFLESMVGSWKVAASTRMGSVDGVSRVSLAAGGTALLQETLVVAGPTTHRSLGVMRVDADGKTIRVWRFDTMSNEPRE